MARFTLTALALFCILGSCSPDPKADPWDGTWSLWSNTQGSRPQYLTLEAVGAGQYLCLLVDQGRDLRRAYAKAEDDGTLALYFEDGHTWVLTLSPQGELRATWAEVDSHDHEDEAGLDQSTYASSFVYLRPTNKELQGILQAHQAQESLPE